MKELKDQLAIGIDIGGTNTKYGIVNHKGEILHKDEIKTGDHAEISTLINSLHEKLTSVINSIQNKNIKGIGIGVPNGNYYTGTIEYAPNLPWKGIVPIAKMMSDKFGIPAALTNDANAAAIGEMMYGAAIGMRDFIMITLGTGVGSGIVANGQLILGHDGFAGELGHTVIVPGGRLHKNTGMHGSLEVYASASGIVTTAVELLQKHTVENSLLRNYPEKEITSKIIYECAIQGDKIAKEVFEFTGKILGEAFANFVMFSSPEAIILFGGVTKAGVLIMKPAKEHMEKNLLPIFQNKVKLIFSKLPQSDVAILGSSALVWEIRPQP